MCCSPTACRLAVDRYATSLQEYKAMLEVGPGLWGSTAGCAVGCACAGVHC